MTSYDVDLQQSQEIKTGLGVTIAIPVVEHLAMDKPIAHQLHLENSARHGVGLDELFLGTEANGAALADDCHHASVHSWRPSCHIRDRLDIPHAGCA